jgi:myosin heavy subunit
MIQRETLKMQTTMPKAFKITPTIKKEIVRIVDDRIKEAHVTKEDFSELKDIVKELATAQKRTELRVEELAVAQKELAEAQKRTEIKVEELAEAQKRTEIKVEELAEAQKRTEIKVEELAEAQKRTEIKVEELAEAQKRTELAMAELANEQKKTRSDLGGLSKSMAYALENEAFRYLPKLLAEKHGINVKERFIRAHIGGKEINVFCQARRDGSDIFIVGEAKLRLDDTKVKQKALEELEEKVEAVVSEYGKVEIVRILITNFATKGFLDQARDRGVIVVQSFEW